MATEKRLIDANEVLQRNEEAFKKSLDKPAEHFVGVIQYHTVKEMVNSSPTVDAVEVVHGCNVYDHDTSFERSVCGWGDWDTMTADSCKYNYCPNCGAKMDGDGNDE